MKSKWIIWSAAGLLCMGAIAVTAAAQGSPGRGESALLEADVLGSAERPQAEDEAFGPADRFAGPGALDEFEMLLPVDVGPGWGRGRGGAMGPGARGRMGRGEAMGPGARGRMGPGRAAGNLHEKLKLTDAQKSKLADIRDKGVRAAIPIQGDLRIARMDLNKLMRAEKPDAKAIDAQIDRIAGLRATLEKGRVAGGLEARAVLTPEQQKLLREHRGGMMGRGMHGMRDGHGMRMRGEPGMRRPGGPGMWMRGGPGRGPRDS